MMPNTESYYRIIAHNPQIIRALCWDMRQQITYETRCKRAMKKVPAGVQINEVLRLGRKKGEDCGQNATHKARVPL
jgi:hypothetical protein